MISESKLHIQKQTNIPGSISYKVILYLLIIAAVTITFASKSSFLYPFNDWCDANAYFTVGKGLVHGLVPYKDLYDHKGFLLYVLHAIAYCISHTSFIGVYFFEIAACFFFLYFCYKTACLYCSEGKKWLLLVFPIFAMFLYATPAFFHGDSVEEFSLPLLMFCMYEGLLYLRGTIKNVFAMAFWAGIACAIILWMKYTVLGFLIGWILILLVLMLAGKKWCEAVRFVSGGILGIAVVSLPILIWFSCKHALGSMFEVYFYNNIFLYDTTSGINIFTYITLNFATMFKKNLIIFLLIALGFIYICGCHRHLKESIYFIATFCSTAFFASSKHYVYYGLVLNIFCVFGLPVILRILSVFIHKLPIHVKNRRRAFSGLALLSVILGAADIFAFSSNSVLLLYSKDELPQYHFAKIIRQSDDPSLLTYATYDSGFYTVLDCIPKTRYFYRPNMNVDAILAEQEKYIKEAVTEFVITTATDFDSPNYEYVATEFTFYENNPQVFYLYQRID